MASEQRARTQGTGLLCNLSLGSDSIHEKNRSVYAGHARLGAGRKVRATHRPFAITETDASGPILQSMLQHHDLADVAVTGAMSRQRAVHLLLVLDVAAPEVESEHDGSEEKKPDHVTTDTGKGIRNDAYSASSLTRCARGIR